MGEARVNLIDNNYEQIVGEGILIRCSAAFVFRCSAARNNAAPQHLRFAAPQHSPRESDRDTFLTAAN